MQAGGPSAPDAPYGPALADQGRGPGRIGVGIFVALLLAGLAFGWLQAELRARDLQDRLDDQGTVAATVPSGLEERLAACIRVIEYLDAFGEAYRDAVVAARDALRRGLASDALEELRVRLDPDLREYRETSLEADRGSCARE